MRKIFTFLLALAASVGMMNAKVTWNSSNVSDLSVFGTYESYSKEGVTLSANADEIYAMWYSSGDESMDGIGFDANKTGGFTFSNTLGKNFTKIEMTLNDLGGWNYANLGSGWSFSGGDGNPATVTWTGNASTVDLAKDESSFHAGDYVKSIVFYFVGDSEAPDPTYTIALQDGTVNADKVKLSATSAVEGATITVTPNEEYEITAFSAYYVVVNGQLGSINEIDATLDPGTGAYSFTMPAYDVTIEATIALKPVPEGDIFAGFTATAGAGGFNNEDYSKLVDGKFTSGTEQTDWTKWCANDGHKSVPTGESGDACWWIDFEASAALNPTGYILTTGNDTGSEHGRNPKNWLLKAKLNADDAWTTIATVTDDVTMKNKSFKDYKFFVDQSGSYQYFRFEVFANQGATVMQLCELRLIGSEAPADNSVKLYHNFYGDWMETEAFGIFDDYTSEYAKISMILEPGDYQFALKVGGELRGDGTAFSRDKQACILAEGLTANLTLNVDVKGTYRFYWFYEENRFAMDVPNVCGMYWQDVTDDKFEVTLGKESEVTLPTVYTTNMGFASNIFRGVDQVRLVSTDETVATIEYTISMDGLGTITIHKAGECDIYAVHDITDYYCYDSVAFHLTVNPESTTYTLQLVADPEKGSVAVTNLLGSGIVDNGDGTYTVPEGAEVTLLATPNEGYEFSGWKASQTICDFAECEFVDLNTVDNPLTFDMYAEAAFMAEFKAVVPTAVENVQTNPVQATKFIRDGQFLIIRDGKTYNVVGTIVR